MGKKSKIGTKKNIGLMKISLCEFLKCYNFKNINAIYIIIFLYGLYI